MVRPIITPQDVSKTLQNTRRRGRAHVTVVSYQVVEERGKREGDREHDGKAASITIGLDSVGGVVTP